MSACPQGVFLRLQQQFRVRLKRRLIELDAVLNGTCDAQLLMAMFHSLEGIGGTFGFPAITEISRRCGDVCVKALEKNRPFTAAEKAKLARAVLEIGAAGAEPCVAVWPHPVPHR